MKIEDINKNIKELNKLKKLLSISIAEEDSIEEKIFKKYLEIESVAKVAKYINDIGYRIRTRKYIANDISDLITNKDIVIKNSELRRVVIKIFNGHKKGKRIFW